MDLSSLTEAQQQQLQQLHQQFQQHQLQQQQQQEQIQQQQEFSSQAYDPSQAQAYDQSSQAYYSYYQYQQQPPQQHYYYQPDYANAYPQQQPQQSQPQQQHQQYQMEPAAVQPPGVSMPPEAPHMVAAAAATVAVHGQGQVQGSVQGQGQGQAQNAYYPPGVGEQQNSSVPRGLNPAAAAAVAALSQLTQFAGTMDAAERAMAGLQERQWQPKNVGYGPMPMPGPMHHGPVPMRPAVGRSPYSGGGRRGGGPFRGGGRGNFGHRPPRPDRSGPPFRGRGRMGRGGSRRFPPNAAKSTSHPAPTLDLEPAASAEGEAAPSPVAQGEAPEAQVPPPSVPALGQAQLSAPAPARGHAALTRRPPQTAWCELCRVDCSSLEILEQHKNGKRHKRNLQRFEGLQNARKPVPTIQNEQKPVPTIQNEQKPVPAIQNEQKPVPTLQSEQKPVPEISNEQKPVPEIPNEQKPVPKIPNEQIPMPESKSEVTVQPEILQGVMDNKPPTAENFPTEATADNKMEIEQQNDSVEQSDVAKVEPTDAPGKRPRMNRFDFRRHGVKRKMRGGWGGKRMRTSEGPRRPVEPPKPKEVVVPLICDLCNVKCDTQSVFDCHLAGKKHLSKLKRFQGHQAMYGAVGLQALYPPNPVAQSTLFITQGHPQTFYGPRGSLPQLTVYGHPQAQQAAAAAATAGSEPQGQRFEPQGSHVILEPGSQKAVTVEPEGQRQFTAVEAGQLAVSVDTKSENSISVSEGMDLRSVVVPPAGNTITGADKVLQAANDSVPIPEYGVTTSEHVVFPGLDIKMVEHSLTNEEPTA